MAQPYDHRAADVILSESASIRQGQAKNITSEEHNNFERLPMPRTWIEEGIVRETIPEFWGKNWFLGFTDITSPTNERTMLSTIIPFSAVANSFPLILISKIRDAISICTLYDAFNSFAFDYVCRQKIGGVHINFFLLKQLPMVNPLDENSNYQKYISRRILELTYTSYDVIDFANDIWAGAYPQKDAYPPLPQPFLWNEERRFLIRCELDAAFFHLYGINRDDVDYIMETFPIVKRKDIQKYGDYRTKLTILKIFDEMKRAMETGKQFQKILDPPAGPPMDAEGNFLSMYRWDRNNWPVHIHQPFQEWEESLLSAWFGVCQKRWNYLQNEQVFPWDGREAFVYALIPHLIQEKPGKRFEFYRDAALLVSRSNRFETLLIDEELRHKYRQLMSSLDWLDFPDEHRIRPLKIRETLQNKGIVQTNPVSGETTVHNEVKLPPLPSEFKPLLPLIQKSADNLDKLQRNALEKAKDAKITFTPDEISNELKMLMRA